MRRRRARPPGTSLLFFFFITRVTGPRRSLSLKLSDTRVYEPELRARLGTAVHFCKVVVLRRASHARSSPPTSRHTHLPSLALFLSLSPSLSLALLQAYPPGTPTARNPLAPHLLGARVHVPPALRRLCKRWLIQFVPAVGHGHTHFASLEWNLVGLSL